MVTKKTQSEVNKCGVAYLSYVFFQSGKLRIVRVDVPIAEEHLSFKTVHAPLDAYGYPHEVNDVFPRSVSKIVLIP